MAETVFDAGWVGVDLDGTLAYYDGWKGEEHIGDPIPLMLQKVKDWIESGRTVKIFTARATVPSMIPYVKEWLKKNGIPQLEITATKDFSMIMLFDDRCQRVETNTGIIK